MLRGFELGDPGGRGPCGVVLRTDFILANTDASIQLVISGGLPGRGRELSKSPGLHRTMAKVCKPDDERTFAGPRGNDKVAPENEPARAGGHA